MINSFLFKTSSEIIDQYCLEDLENFKEPAQIGVKL